MAFDLDSYEPVASRFGRFIEWAATNEHTPSVRTEMLSEPGAEICVIKTSILLDDVVIATGHAEEVRDTSGKRTVNSTSHVENCETSSLGRCLANFPLHNFAGSDFTKRPSREEMSKVARMSTTTQEGSDVVTERPHNAPSDKQLWLVKKLFKDAGKLPPHNLGSMDKFEVSRLIEQLKGGEEVPPPSDNDAPEEPF
jgi:hypothetical protein